MMMTKTSKCLTIAATVFSVVFMAVSAVMWTARTDWKQKADVEFPKKRIAEQAEILKGLDDQIKDVDVQQKKSVAAIASDELAVLAPNVGLEAQLEVELANLIEEAHALHEQIEAEAKKVEVKQDVGKRLREEVLRLTSQYEDLVAQKEDALANVKRIRDLLFQANGVLDRVKKRQKSLESDYEAEEIPGPAASRPSRAVKSS